MHPTEVEYCTLASASETACIGAVNVPVTLEGRVGILEVLVVPEGLPRNDLGGRFLD
jgi:hypothetical protein